jgi:hypothetical protein
MTYWIIAYATFFNELEHMKLHLPQRNSSAKISHRQRLSLRNGIRSTFSYWQVVQDSSLLDQFVASLEEQ